MERRKFLIGAGSAAVGASAVIGSGAFTSVSADRDVAVTVADDSDALLAIERETSDGGPTANASEYVDVNADGTVSLDFSGDDTDGLGNGDANGVNKDATTVFDDLLKITNQGTQDVIVGYSSDVDEQNGFALYEEDPDQGNSQNDGQLNIDTASGGASDLPVLSPGETLNNIGAFTYGDPSEFSGTVTFKAAASADDL